MPTLMPERRRKNRRAAAWPELAGVGLALGPPEVRSAEGGHSTRTAGRKSLWLERLGHATYEER